MDDSRQGGITDELRKLAEDPLLGYASKKTHKEVVIEIADRIDEEHRKAMIRAGQLLDGAEKERDYNYANWQECKQKVLQHNITMDELSAEIERLKDELAHSIELPKDADGEPIHVGDVVERTDPPRHPAEVVSMVLFGDGDWQIHMDERQNVHASYQPSLLRHHRPTAEDLLRQFLGECEHASMLGYTDMPQNIFDTYTAKLRLADDGKGQ